MHCRTVLLLLPAVSLAVACQVSTTEAGKAARRAGIPVRFRLDRPAFVTLVVEDAAGNRVRSLLAETRLPAGENTVYWDGYDDGTRGRKGKLIRRRVLPGTYRLRGLTHDGIRMFYEMTVDNPGSPPWATRDGSGGWLADHSPPADILWLPEGVPAPNGKGSASFLVCSTSAEAGDEFVWLDAEGRRLYGMNDGFWGGTHLARDPGPRPARDYCAYVLQSGQRDPDNFTLEVRGFRADGGRLESVLKYPRPRSLRTFKGHEQYGSDGLAVYNGRIVFAVTMLNKLVFADARQRKVIGEAALPTPRSPVFDRDGRLYVLSDSKVKRFHVPAAELRLEREETVVGTGLDDPRRLGLDDEGNVYVSDWGRNHQVKAFDPRGRLVRAVGKAGGPQLGLYDEGRMAHPCGFARDGKGRLWVAEGDVPRRLSVWAADGAFLKAFYGPTKYGGGGALDARDRTRLYYDDAGKGIEFALDWARGTCRPRSVYWRDDAPGFETMPGPAPERAFHVSGHQYLVNCYNGGLRYNQDRGVGIWRMGADGVARPVALIGNGADLVNRIWGWRMKHRDAITHLWQGRKAEDVLFVWADRNGDGIAQPDEIQWVSEDHSSAPQHEIGGLGLEPLVHPDLSFTTAYGTRVPPPTIDKDGVPHYDLAKRAVVGNPRELRSPLVVGNRAVTHEDADGSWVGFDLKGGRRWRYPATPEEEIGGPGALVAPTRLLGPAVEPAAGESGPVLAVNGEMGAVFLLTTDGLFVQTLGGDARLLPPISERRPRRGWAVKDITFRQEHFHPTINQTSDGQIYLVAGFADASLLRLDGWQSVRRRDIGAVEVTAQDLAAIPPESVQPSRKQGRPTTTVALLSRGPKVDGDLSDWPPDTPWLRIDERASAAVAADGHNLYVAFRTNDPNALDNTAPEDRYLFKGGGALDLMLGTDPQAPRQRQTAAAGDLRLVVTRSRGRTRAVLYRAVVAGVPDAEQVRFESPVGKVVFAQVRTVSDEIRLTQDGGIYQLVVPLKLLGLRPTAGTEILADVGILRGREGRTTQRSYWSNLNTVLVSDLPGEARLQPGHWGVWMFKSRRSSE
jgi:sugar lactone lactonase YvrE